MTWKKAGLLFLYLTWNYWRVKQTLEGMKHMEDNIKLGSVGDLDLALSGGKATVKLSATAGVASVGLTAEASMSVTMDSAVLVDKLFAAMEKALPAGAIPIEEGIKLMVKEAISKI